MNSIRSYHDRILRVYDYIKQNLAGDISVDRLSDVACLSPYHFHRVYRRLVGETLNGAARRCRLYEAGRLLTETTNSVGEIAYRTGYNRIDSFSRAFQRFYTVSPDSFRQHQLSHHILVAQAMAASDSGATNFIGIEDVSLVSSLYGTTADKLYQVEVIHVPRTELIGLRSDSTQEVLEPKYVDLNLQAQSYQLDLSNQHFLGLFHKDPRERGVNGFEHRYAVAALPINAAQRDRLEKQSWLPFGLYSIPAGYYASYIYTGPYSMSERSHQWLMGYWLPANGLRACKAPVIEQYLNDPRSTGPSQLRTRVFIQVEHH